jgi:hypothetical protein
MIYFYNTDTTSSYSRLGALLVTGWPFYCQHSIPPNPLFPTSPSPSLSPPSSLLLLTLLKLSFPDGYLIIHRPNRSDQLVFGNFGKRSEHDDLLLRAAPKGG